MLQFVEIVLVVTVVFIVWRAIARLGAGRNTAAREHPVRWKRESGVDVTGGDGHDVWTHDMDNRILDEWGEGDLDRESRRVQERAIEDQRRDEPDWSAWSTPDGDSDWWS